MQARGDVKYKVHRLATKTRPTLTLFLILLFDALSLSISAYLSLLFTGHFLVESGLYFWPLIGIVLLAYALEGLYPGIGLAPAEELRRIVISTTFVYLTLGLGIYLISRDTRVLYLFVSAWLFSIVLVPLSRALLRHLFAHQSWWGYPVIIFGAGKTGKMVVHALKRQPGLGLKPVALLDDNPEKQGFIYDIPVAGGLELAPTLASELRVQRVIVAMPGVPRAKLLELIEKYNTSFSQLIFIPDLFDFYSLWVTAKDLGGVLGLEVTQKLAHKTPRLIKRSMDLLLSSVLGLVTLPLIATIALLIKLDSEGPVFYLQERLGKDGRRFKAVKFRTMYGDGEARLAKLLAENPALREEYERYHKLRNDPRVTRIGKYLRKYSLDELPQIWNVLKGEMSLVGPRAYLPRELPKMGGAEKIILKVLPGITGLWQVSGRNEVTFEERLKLDIYYVRNWSIWLDIYILARTVWVVLFGKGAY